MAHVPCICNAYLAVYDGTKFRSLLCLVSTVLETLHIMTLTHSTQKKSQ